MSLYHRRIAAVLQLLSVNKASIEGSGIGPTLYIAMKSDLTTVGDFNVIIKYADDVDLLVPEHSPIAVA